MSESENKGDKFRKPLQRPALNLPARRGDAPEEPPAEEAPVPGGLARLLDAIAKMLSPKPPQATDGQPAPAPADPPVFTVLVAAMAGDTPDGAASQAVYRALATKPALTVKPLPKPFPLDSMEDPAQVATVVAATRQAAAMDNADLLVWGEVGKDGYRLRFATASAAEDDRTGLFGVSTRIELPLAWSEAQLDMLYAAVLAAADTTTEVQKAALRRLLPAAAAPLEAMAAKPSLQLSMPQQRSVQTIFGHVAVATAQVVPPSQADGWLEKAVATYRASEKRLARHEPPWELGLIRKQVATALTLRAERAKDQAQELLETAAAEWRGAVELLSKASMPLEWASAQTRLGVVLHRLDLLTGDTELLREAVQALQGALSVYSRTENPQRWADIMHSLAQVLEVYGDQLRSAEVLKRAIDACEAVLEIRTRDRTPLAWAAIQNTLGSALFLLDKHSGGARHITDAVAAFAGALEVFQAHGRKGPAQVAARNLARARKLAEDRKGRQVIDPHWADE